MLEAKYKSRREFLKSCLRFGVGGGLVITGLALGLRKKSDESESDLCQISSPCNGCSQYKGCNLPKAAAVKKNEHPQGGPHGR